MKRLKFSLALAITLSSLVSCDTTDYEEPEFNTVCDVFVQVKKVGDETHYAPTFYAYSNKNLFTVDVEDSSTPVNDYELSEYFKGNLVFRSIPNEADFSTTDIVNGEYTFSIVSQGNESLKVKDKLLESRVEPIEISDFTYNGTIHKVELNWDKTEEADIYVVKVLTEINGKVIFASPRLTSTDYEFSELSNGWASGLQLSSGTSYWVGVYAYEFENPTQDNGYNINSFSVDYNEIVW